MVVVNIGYARTHPPHEQACISGKRTSTAERESQFLCYLDIDKKKHVQVEVC
jgi:hypothetical protein